MLRSDELREKIEKLAKELSAMKDKADKENRSASDEERIKANGILDEIDSFEMQLDNALLEERMDDKFQSLKKGQRPGVKPDVKRVPEEDRKFRSFGEFLQAVMVAGSPGGSLDHRLNRAATGMSEGIPSDGGLA